MSSQPFLQPAIIVRNTDGQRTHVPALPAGKSSTKPDKNDELHFLDELHHGDHKYMEWLRKLGNMLASTDSSKYPKHPAGYVLAEFPQHYRLFEHRVTSNASDPARAKNRRADLYLHGHPKGKPFRSPNEFRPHLIWLTSDPTYNPNNCNCENCPYFAVLPEPLSSASTATTGSGDSSRRVSSNSRATPSAPGGSSTSEPPKGHQSGRRPSSSNNHQRSHASPAASSLATSTTPASSVPAPLPEPKYLEQYLDSRYAGFFFRPGELVWFRRAGDAYALGIVLRRSEENGQRQYDMSPLSHPDDNMATVRCPNEALVPWLAWPPPPFFHGALNHLPNPPHYQRFDWQGLRDGKYGQGSIEVDASIMAANMINCTWTPLGLIKDTLTDFAEKHYEALFLGAEKIWLGDAVRLQSESESDSEVLIVHQILEEEQPSGITAKLVGDVYRLKIASDQDLGDLQNPSIPERLKVDLEKCNVQSMRVEGKIRVWKSLEYQRKVGLDQIKGRWHEASLLLPRLLAGDTSKNHLVNGIAEISRIMRSRSDPISWQGQEIPVSFYRTGSRRAAIGNAMSGADELQDGLGPPLSQSGNPTFEPMDDINWDFDTDGQTVH